jgi:hypothetical protein
LSHLFAFFFVSNFRIARNIEQIRSRIFTKNFLKIFQH